MSHLTLGLRTAAELIAKTTLALDQAHMCLTLEQLQLDSSRLAVDSSLALLHQLHKDWRVLPRPLLP
jgi:hypothetical protein